MVATRAVSPASHAVNDMVIEEVTSTMEHDPLQSLEQEPVAQNSMKPSTRSSRSSLTGSNSKLKGLRVPSNGVPTSPASLPTPRSTPKLTPRETKSSLLRRSMGSGDGSSLRAALAAMKDGSSTPNAAGSELSRLRNDLRVKQKEVEELEIKLADAQASLSSKERALGKAQTSNESLKAKTTRIEGDLLAKTKSARSLESEKLQLESQLEELRKETDRLRRKLDATPKGTGLSEAIAVLEGEIKQVKAENAKLSHDNKGASNQIRAKDKELTTMALEVEAAHEILIQNGELENYIMDLRTQLEQVTAEKATLTNVQRKLRDDIAKLNEEVQDAKNDTATAKHDLSICQTQLQASEDSNKELRRELDIRRNELHRVGKVAQKAAHKDAHSLKEEGMIEFHQHKEEVMQLMSELNKTKEKLRLADEKAKQNVKSLKAPKTNGNAHSNGAVPSSENIVPN